MATLIDAKSEVAVSGARGVSPTRRTTGGAVSYIGRQGDSGSWSSGYNSAMVLYLWFCDYCCSRGVAVGAGVGW